MKHNFKHLKHNNLKAMSQTEFGPVFKWNELDPNGENFFFFFKIVIEL